MLSRYFLSLLLVLGALAACDKTEPPVPWTGPPPTAPSPVVIVPQAPENLCLLSTTRTVDTVVAGVQLVGPYNGFTWDEISWNTYVEVPGVTKSNQQCVKVYVARAGSGVWKEIPNGATNPPDATAAFWANPGSTTGSIWLWSGVLEPKLGDIDLGKKIDVKVSYRVK